MLVLRTITLLWPFLRELFLGRKTLREAMRTHKGRCFAIAVILASFAYNTWSTQKLISISRGYVELKQKYNAVTKNDKGDFTPSQEVVEDLKDEVNRLRDENQRLKPKAPAVPAPATPTTVTAPDDRYNTILQRLDTIKTREESGRF